MTKEHKEQKKAPSHKRSITTYIIILFAVAFLLLLLAYFTEERAIALSSAQLTALGLR